MYNQSATRGSTTNELMFVAKQGIFSTRPSPLYNNVVKRIFDALFVILALPFLLPFLVIVAILVARDGHSPLYSQERIGRGGRAFKMWKFRTMVPNAKAKLQELIDHDPEVAQEWNAHQKLKNDPRITAIGHLLRKTSVDELPQLWNVLKGDMSVVGPRPIMTDQKDIYSGKAYRRMRPGMTGLWQISDRNNCTFSARASFDNDYYEQMSLATDVKIITATVGVVVRGTGC